MEQSAQIDGFVRVRLRTHGAAPEVAERVANEALRAFLAAGSERREQAAHDVDETLERLVQEHVGKLDVAVAGKLSGEHGFADIHLPLPDGSTLTIGLSRRPLPPLFMRGQNVRGLGNAVDGGTTTFNTTASHNSCLDDQVGDTD
jgi:hypothetical protein